MRKRACPFCHGEPSKIFGVRGGIWVRCEMCRSVFRDITPGMFEQLHDDACQDHHFVDTVVSVSGMGPTTFKWEKLAIPGASLLEIGPGTGHLLAAAHEAGRTVAGVEASEVHRTFIRDTWGIDSLSFDAIVMINVLEHVYDIAGFLRSAAELLAPGGVMLVSTVNAVSLEAALLRGWWSMCKEHDHVSFPSPAGLASAGRAAGLRAERLWSAELPFELPVSALVAARDWAQARHGRQGNASRGHRAGPSPGGLSTAAKARLARLYSASAGLDPASRLLGALGRAATVKAHFRPATS
jgi:SAM-dependent methyltransferase